jgi:hypothetical protein
MTMKNIVLLVALFVSSLALAQQPLPLTLEGLTVQPILENDDLPGDRYIQDLKLVYTLPAFCSDSVRAVFVFSDRVFYTPIKKTVCTGQVGFVRLTDEMSRTLSRVPLLAIRLENTWTGESYPHPLIDRDYFIDVYRLDDRW